MNLRSGSCLFALCTGMLVVWAPEARAEWCQGWQFGFEGVDVVLGEEQVGGVGTGQLAMCYRPAGGGPETYVVVHECSTATPEGNQFFIWGTEGNDTAGPLAKPILCDGTWMLPWNASFKFGLAAFMGSGSDTVYGTPNADTLFSYYQYAYPPMVLDASNDRLCGYGGDDVLMGDGDESAEASECLNGGPGTDTCNGGDDGSAFDTAYACEDTSHAVTSTEATCSCGTEPPSFW